MTSSLSAGDGKSCNPVHVTSRSNPLLKEIQRLASGNGAYRRSGRIWVEGDHLCRAALTRGCLPEVAVFAESNWPPTHGWIHGVATKIIVLSDVLFRESSGLGSSADCGFLLAIPPAMEIERLFPTVVLDRLQDAGNVGSILRSAAAFGFMQVVALKGTAALWGPKVLRAGMGAHFGLRLIEAVEPQMLISSLAVPLFATSSHGGAALQSAALAWPCAWVLGHEGQGVCPELMEAADQLLRIGQPGGEESLNVAAAAAICLHASSVAHKA